MSNRRRSARPFHRRRPRPSCMSDRLPRVARTPPPDKRSGPCTGHPDCIGRSETASGQSCTNCTRWVHSRNWSLSHCVSQKFVAVAAAVGALAGRVAIHIVARTAAERRIARLPPTAHHGVARAVVVAPIYRTAEFRVPRAARRTAPASGIATRTDHACTRYRV